MIISSAKEINIGDSVLVGWDCTIIDSDGHEIINRENVVVNEPKKTVIGNHVWLAAKSTVMKGSVIPDNSIIAMGSMINRCFNEKNVLIAGQPGKIVKESVDWKS